MKFVIVLVVISTIFNIITSIIGKKHTDRIKHKFKNIRNKYKDLKDK